MLEKIRKNKIFSKLSMMAYLVDGIIFLNPLNLQGKLLLKGDTLVLCYAVIFLIGMVLQFIQILCCGGNVIDPWPTGYTLTEEESEELSKFLKEEFD